MTFNLDLAAAPTTQAFDGPAPAPSQTEKIVREGTLVLIGGACTPQGDALGAFVQLASTADGSGPVVGITSASQSVRESAERWRSDFATAGVGEAVFPIIETREDASNPEFVKLIDNARGVFLGGGNQVKLISLLSGTKVGDALWNHYVNGGIVCGTSAGAAALTELTLAGNEVDEEGNLVEQYVGPGLGLLDFKTLIDTHFSQRRRLYRLFVAIAEYPHIMGLGIDEDTAMIVKGERGTVVGRGGVTFVDGRTVRYANADEVTKGRQLTLSALRVGIVGTGYTFNLRERELEALLD
ncbi:MAG TPA: cyanophycinase [Gemmatimonadaceae bacterium]|nr:cyanophycinase [Gemmatimonadaceae bacterium]